MPRCFALKASGLQITHLFNIDYAVGERCTNAREDVMLVQYLLFVWLWKDNDPRINQILNQLFGAGAIPMFKADGIYGNQTKLCIKAFEIINQQVSSDGRIDPLETAGTPSGKSSKIFLLNQFLYSAGGLRGGIPQTAIPFPQALVRPLFRG